MDRASIEQQLIAEKPDIWRGKVRGLTHLAVAALLASRVAPTHREILDSLLKSTRETLSDPPNKWLLANLRKHGDVVDDWIAMDPETFALSLRATVELHCPGWNNPTDIKAIVAVVRESIVEQLRSSSSIPDSWRDRIEQVAEVVGTIEVFPPHNGVPLNDVLRLRCILGKASLAFHGDDAADSADTTVWIFRWAMKCLGISRPLQSTTYATLMVAVAVAALRATDD